jgi:hypothetical protein
VRTAEPDRLARRAGGAGGERARSAAGAAPPVDRRGPDPLRVVRRRGAADPGGRRRLARRGHRSVLDARLGEPRVRARGERDRSGSGSTRSSSCR